VLGWYREGDPELADWQIKWAVEHGITFFAYDAVTAYNWPGLGMAGGGMRAPFETLVPAYRASGSISATSRRCPLALAPFRRLGQPAVARARTKTSCASGRTPNCSSRHLLDAARPCSRRSA